MKNVVALKRFEKRFLLGVLAVWAVCIICTFSLRSETISETNVPITVYKTNTVNVRVPLSYTNLRTKYLLLARLYEETRINANVLSKQVDRLILTNAYTLNQLREEISKKDAPKNMVSAGVLLAPDFGYELTYHRHLWKCFWAYGRIQTPVGASAGIGVAF